ncbi:hypothetical protein [Streptomyces sp. NPDC003832]
MADRLTVDGDELTRFMSSLRKSTSSLNGVRKALLDSTVNGLGTDDLDCACEAFQDDWTFGAEVLEDTHGLVTKLLDGSYWKGDAAVAFREQLDDGPLPRNLKNAARSLRKAATQLNRWEGELDDFQKRAAPRHWEGISAEDLERARRAGARIPEPVPAAFIAGQES